MSKIADAFKSVLPTLRRVAPVLAGAIAGPAGTQAVLAVEALAATFGGDPRTPETVAAAFNALPPERLLEAQKAEQAYQVRLKELEIDALRVEQQGAAVVNTTMQAEASSAHWPTYSWRPAIGFAVAFNVVCTSVVVGTAYAMVIWGLSGTADEMDARTDALQHIPAMIGAMAALIGVVSPILGIASWFRGRMQADPNVPSDNRG